MVNPLARMRDSLVEQLGDTKAYGELMERTEELPMNVDAKLKVIGAGYSRTGTLSTYSAFLTLGMKVRYFPPTFSCFSRPVLNAGTGVT